MRPTIGAAKLPVPPSPATATVKSVASYTANVPPSATTAWVRPRAVCRREMINRATMVLKTAAPPMARPQLKLFTVLGYSRTPYPIAWLAIHKATVIRMASVRESVIAARTPNAVNGVAQAKTKLSALTARARNASQAW